MVARTSGEARHALKGGVVAGIIGGVAMSVFMMAMNVFKGQDIWMGAKMPALPLLGERAMEPGFDAWPVLLGMMSHFGVSIGWGVLFALLVFGLARGATVAAGALWGVVVWLGMFYVVLPIVGAGAVVKMMPVGIAIFEHVLFGLAVGIGFLRFQRARQPPSHPIGRQVPVAS